MLKFLKLGIIKCIALYHLLYNLVMMHIMFMFILLCDLVFKLLILLCDLVIKHIVFYNHFIVRFNRKNNYV